MRPYMSELHAVSNTEIVKSGTNSQTSSLFLMSYERHQFQHFFIFLALSFIYTLISMAHRKVVSKLRPLMGDDRRGCHSVLGFSASIWQNRILLLLQCIFSTFLSAETKRPKDTSNFGQKVFLQNVLLSVLWSRSRHFWPEP